MVVHLANKLKTDETSTVLMHGHTLAMIMGTHTHTHRRRG